MQQELGSEQANKVKFWKESHRITGAMGAHMPLLQRVKNLEALRTARYQKEIAEQSQLITGPITPNNLSLRHYHHTSSDVPLHFDENYYCVTEELAKLQFDEVWIFDADDTLWEDNYYYEQMKKMLFDHIKQYESDFDFETLMKKIDEVEHETLKTIGFGPIGFAKSLRKVAEFYVNKNSNIPMPEEFLNAIPTLLTHLPLEVPDVTVTTLESLKKRNVGLVLYTRGKPEVQFPKIARSEIGHYFHAIQITKSKDVASLRALVDKLSVVNAKEYCYVGNSLKSDITPAVQLSMTAYYYDNPNTWHFEHCELSSASYVTINRLDDIFRYMLQLAPTV